MKKGSLAVLCAAVVCIACQKADAQKHRMVIDTVANAPKVLIHHDPRIRAESNFFVSGDSLYAYAPSTKVFCPGSPEAVNPRSVAFIFTDDSTFWTYEWRGIMGTKMALCRKDHVADIQMEYPKK